MESHTGPGRHKPLPLTFRLSFSSFLTLSFPQLPSPPLPLTLHLPLCSSLFHLLSLPLPPPSLQHEVQQGIACVFYVEQLVRHAQPELKEKRPKKKLLDNLQPLGRVLSDLEVDLRTNPNDS